MSSTTISTTQTMDMDSIIRDMGSAKFCIDNVVKLRFVDSYDFRRAYIYGPDGWVCVGVGISPNDSDSDDSEYDSDTENSYEQQPDDVEEDLMADVVDSESEKDFFEELLDYVPDVKEKFRNGAALDKYYDLVRIEAMREAEEEFRLRDERLAELKKKSQLS